MTDSIKNCELRIVNRRFSLCGALFFCVLCAFAGNSFAQNLDALTEQVKRGDAEQKRDALLQIRNIESESASRAALPALKDSSEIVRATAAASIVFLPKSEAVQTLLPSLRDKSALVRREAAYALGTVGDAQAIEPLLKVFQTDKILEVRNAAIVALGNIGDASAVNDLVKILEGKPQAKEEFTRRSAARSIGQIAETIQTGKRVVATPENFLPEASKQNGASNRRNLVSDYPMFQAAVGVLITTLSNANEFPDARREAAFALGAISSGDAITILQANANAEDYYLAEICREALNKISGVSDYQPKIVSPPKTIKK